MLRFMGSQSRTQLSDSTELNRSGPVTYEKAKCFPSLKKETDMVINEMGCRGSCVRKEKAVWKRRECLGNCKQFHAEGSLSCKKYVTWAEAGRNRQEPHP